MTDRFVPQHDPDVVLHSPFDYETHNETFKAYCEVVILQDGTIEYGVPSHIEKLKQVYRDMFRSDPDADCPAELYFDYMGWLAGRTSAVPVWYREYGGEPNKVQRLRLRQLQMHGCCDFTGRSLQGL